MILGYPKEKPLYVSYDCQLKDSSTRAEGLQHNCDTLAGNSGSPIFNRSTQSVIGIHNGGDDWENYGTETLDRDFFTVAENVMAQRLWQTSDQTSSFGPFGDNQDILLRHFYFNNSKPDITIRIEMDIEDGYDFIMIRDGSRGIRRITGKIFETLSLTTPATISFSSDYAGSSKRVTIERID